MKRWAFSLTIGAIAAISASAALASGPTIVPRTLDQRHGLYELEVASSVKSFKWGAPLGLQLRAIKHIDGGGRCHIAQNAIHCTGARQYMTIDFTATVDAITVGTGGGGGPAVRVTPVAPDYAPSGGGEPDLPLCSPGTQPGPDNPCYVQ
jgi:hypothetical protein